MPLSDVAVLVATALFTAMFVAVVWRRGVRGRRLLAAGWLAFFGFMVTDMMLAHSIEIGYHSIVGGTSFTGAEWKFDFRTYSLQLLGAVLIWQGVRSILAAFGIARGDVSARRAAFVSMGLVLAVVAPLIYIHAFFGYLLSGLSVVSMLVVAVAVREKKPDFVAA